VDSFDEEICTAKPGDSFASLAEKYYHNPKYEKALVLYNCNHPMATTARKTDPGVLQPNQPVYIPEAKILERRYGDVIPDLTPLPQPGATTAPSAGGFAPSPTPSPGAASPGLLSPSASGPGASSPSAPNPVALNPSPPNPVALNPAVSNPAVPQPSAPTGTPTPGPTGAPAAPALRDYKVQNGAGELLYQIAQSQLGRGDRWPEIRDLNRNISPDQPVPAGTVLRLPAQ
jgi:hypothetical protein